MLRDEDCGEMRDEHECGDHNLSVSVENKIREL